MRIVTDTAGDHQYSARVRAARGLHDSLPDADVVRLLEFLGRPTGRDPLSRPIEVNAIKNDTMLALLRQRHPPDEIASVLADGFRDPAADPAWRDYCLQFIPNWIEAAAPEPAARARLVEVLREAAESERANFAGTALISLDRLHEGGAEEVEPAELGRLAMRVFRRETTRQAARVPALHVAAAHEAPGALAEARRAMEDAEAFVPLRMAALNIVARRGGPADIARVARLRQSGDSRLRIAGIHSLERLRQRFPRGASATAGN